MSSKILKNFGITLTKQVDDVFASATANTYVTIGRPVTWASSDTSVETPEETTNYTNQVYRDMIAMKKIIGADIQIIVPREDWVANTVYDEYDDGTDLFTTISTTKIQGTANVNANSVIVVGKNTQFSTNVANSNIIKINGVSREVVNVVNNTFLTVNTKFSTANIVSNLVYKIVDSAPHYSEKFYVRNSKDQIFKCLFNNNGANSNVQPEITVAGQLPEDPYIELADGYRWKYLYSIPASKKLKFMNKDWMPVLTDTTVARTAGAGRVDIVKILDGGDGYISSGTSNAVYNIITLSGDGKDANISANIINGVFVGLDILNGGSGYSYANVVIDDTGTTGANAEFDVVISPQNGHGSDPTYELGASHVMIAVELDGDEGGKIPTISGSEKLDYRQIGLLLNPRLYPANTAFANASVYTTSTRFNLVAPSSGNKYDLDETVYQTLDTFANSTFTGVVVHWDYDTKTLHLNNTRGTANLELPIKGLTSGTETNITTIEDTEVSPFTGRLLYLDNRSPIVRDDQQAELIRLIVKI